MVIFYFDSYVQGVSKKMFAVGFCCLSEEVEALLMIFYTKECNWAQRTIMLGKIRFDPEFKMAAHYFMPFC